MFKFALCTLIALSALSACSQGPSELVERVATQPGQTRMAPPALKQPPALPTIRGNATTQRAPGETVEQRLANLGFSAEVHVLNMKHPERRMR